MKTFTQCMTEIESAIRLRQYGPHKSWLLVYHENNFKMIIGRNPGNVEIIIKLITERMATDGLDTAEWYDVEKKVRALLLQGVIK